ncbi:MAG TPA: 3-phosphoshikimate 1-carboxyvinyltransferase [bacterium]|nr:3-phosphoshikimate 1-carboxyvinyltransferase [bacterium]
MNVQIKKAHRLSGTLQVPGDKSISHRALICAALAKGRSHILGLAHCEDVNSTIRCLQDLGAIVISGKTDTTVEGKGVLGFKKPAKILDAGNSGTTIRLLSGVLAGQPFESQITGDDSLRQRPMARIIEPLRSMGAQISGVDDQFAPLLFKPSTLKPALHRLKIASAQVKSCLLLAGLYAGATTVIEPAPSRNHTEIMLDYLGVPITVNGNMISVRKCDRIQSEIIRIPADISAAAFFMVAATIVPDSELMLKNVGLNPTRTGIIDVLKSMGAQIRLQNLRKWNNENIGDVLIRSSRLKGIKISGETIPRIIDEIPVLAVAATQAEGETIISDARELRFKETDRISATVENLTKMGCAIEARSDAMIIQGNQSLNGCSLMSFGDHRIAMSFAVAGLVADGTTTIWNVECCHISFPEFFEQLRSLVDG